MWDSTIHFSNGSYAPAQNPTDEVLIPMDFVLRHYNARMGGDNRLSFEILCDGSGNFLGEMVAVLERLGCDEIDIDCRIVDKAEAPSGKPWCNCLFEASGIVPEETAILLKSVKGYKLS